MNQVSFLEVIRFHRRACKISNDSPPFKMLPLNLASSVSVCDKLSALIRAATAWRTKRNCRGLPVPYCFSSIEGYCQAEDTM